MAFNIKIPEGKKYDKLLMRKLVESLEEEVKKLEAPKIPL